MSPRCRPSEAKFNGHVIGGRVAQVALPSQPQGQHPSVAIWLDSPADSLAVDGAADEVIGLGAHVSSESHSTAGTARCFGSALMTARNPESGRAEGERRPTVSLAGFRSCPG